MARGSIRHNSMDSWLGSKTGGGRRRGNMVGNWKKEKGFIDTFLSTKQAPVVVYRHPVPTRIPIEDRETKETRIEVFNKEYCCHESIEVLDAQYERDEDGKREKPPERCGICKLREFLWIECNKWIESSKPLKAAEGEKPSGKRTSKVGIDPCLKIFEFKTEDPRNSADQKIMAGTFCGVFSQKELPDELTRHAKACKVNLKEAWKGNANAKCEYVLTIVDANDVAKGLQIAVETQALGMKVQDAINKVVKGEGVSYSQNPYCIRWEKKATDEHGKKLYFSDVYDAYPMKKFKITPQILTFIKSAKVPDLAPVITPFNQQTVHAMLVQNCLKPDLIPWDKIFPSQEQEEKWKKEDEEEAETNDGGETEEDEEEGEEGDEEEGGDEEEEEEEEEEEGEGGDEEEEEKPKKKTTAKKPKDDVPDQEEVFECDNEDCLKPVKASDSKCPHCGFEFEVSEKPPEEEKPKPRKRSELKAEASKAATKPKKSKPKDEEDEAEPDSEVDEDVPF